MLALPGGSVSAQQLSVPFFCHPLPRVEQRTWANCKRFGLWPLSAVLTWSQFCMHPADSGARAGPRKIAVITLTAATRGTPEQEVSWRAWSCPLISKARVAVPFAGRFLGTAPTLPLLIIFLFFSPCSLLVFAPSSFWPFCFHFVCKALQQTLPFYTLLWLPPATFLYVALFPIGYFCQLSAVSYLWLLVEAKKESVNKA